MRRSETRCITECDGCGRQIRTDYSEPAAEIADFCTTCMRALEALDPSLLRTVIRPELLKLFPKAERIVQS